jgi:hypothetical protein
MQTKKHSRKKITAAMEISKKAAVKKVAIYKPTDEQIAGWMEPAQAWMGYHNEDLANGQKPDEEFMWIEMSGHMNVIDLASLLAEIQHHRSKQLLRPAYERYLRDFAGRRTKFLTYKQFELNKVMCVNSEMFAKMGRCGLCYTDLSLDCEHPASGVTKNGMLVCAYEPLCRSLRGKRLGICISCDKPVDRARKSPFFGTKTAKGWKHKDHQKIAEYMDTIDERMHEALSKLREPSLTS